jgi:hypothetical protein
MEVNRAEETVQTLDQRLLQEAAQLRVTAKGMKPGAARQSMLRKARDTETGARILGWILSPGLQCPK